MSDAAPAAAVDVDSDKAFTRQRRLALLLLFLAFGLSVTDRQILAILAEPIKQDMHLADWQIGLLSGFAFSLFYVTLGIPIASLADRGHRKEIIATSLAVFSGFSALCGVTQNFWQLMLARFGVAVGEAGVSPSSHSILADYYPPKNRNTVMSIMVLGANAGMMLGFIGGGQIAEHYGWRAVFFWTGVPGLLLALAVQVFLKTPPRGHSEGRVATGERPSIVATARYMWGNLAMRHLIVGATISTGIVSGTSQWQAAFFMRSYDMSVGQAGVVMGLMGGVLGALGTFMGGFLTDRLQRHRMPYGLRLVAIIQALSVPFAALGLFAPSPQIALAYFLLPIFAATFHSGPSLGLIQSLSRLRMRAMAAAIMMLCFNLLGAGVGPLVIGILSDALQPQLGNDSLRVAMLALSLLYLWAALHFFLSSRHLETGLASATRED